MKVNRKIDWECDYDTEDMAAVKESRKRRFVTSVILFFSFWHLLHVSGIMP